MLYYELFITILVILAIMLIVLDFNNIIDLNVKPYKTWGYIILITFWIDYVYFYINSKNKKEYFKKNIFNLIAILPLNEVLSILIFFRIFRLTKFVRLIKVFSFIVILKPKIQKFLYTNGFIYSLYFTTILITISSILMHIIEKNNFSDSLWWSIVTATTVGYRDISPKTFLGRIIAVILMFTGIGFISMLTSTITNYFIKKINNEDKYIKK